MELKDWYKLLTTNEAISHLLHEKFQISSAMLQERWPKPVFLEVSGMSSEYLIGNMRILTYRTHLLAEDSATRKWTWGIHS